MAQLKYLAPKQFTIEITEHQFFFTPKKRQRTTVDCHIVERRVLYCDNMNIAVSLRSAAVNHKTHMCSCSDCTKIGTIQRRLLLCINIGDLYVITLYKNHFQPQ